MAIDNIFNVKIVGKIVLPDSSTMPINQFNLHHLKPYTNSKIKGNKNKCYYCGQDELCTKDHFIPKSKKGCITVYACTLCQGSKGALMPLDWLNYILNHNSITKEKKKRIDTAVTSLWGKICK